MEPDEEANSEQLSPFDIIPQSTKYDLPTILDRNAMTTTVIRLQICHGMVPERTTYTIRGFWECATERLRSTYVPTHKAPSITLGTASHSVLVIFQIAEIETPRSGNSYPVYPSMPTEHFWR